MFSFWSKFNRYSSTIQNLSPFKFFLRFIALVGTFKKIYQKFTFQFAFRKNCQRCQYWRNHYQIVRIKHCEFEKPKLQPVSKKRLSFKLDPPPPSKASSVVGGSVGSLSRISECHTIPLSESEEDLETINGKPERNYDQSSHEADALPLTVAVNTVVISDPITCNSYPRVLLLNYTTSTPKPNSVFNFHTRNENRQCFFRGMETHV